MAFLTLFQYIVAIETFIRIQEALAEGRVTSRKVWPEDGNGTSGLRKAKVEATDLMRFRVQANMVVT